MPLQILASVQGSTCLSLYASQRWVGTPHYLFGVLCPFIALYSAVEFG